MADTPETAESEAPAAGGANKKLIVIIVAAILLAAGLSAGAAWFFMGRSSETQAQADGKGAKEHGKQGKEGKKEKKPSGPAIYYKIDPALVVNFQSNGVTRFLQVAIEVSTRDAEIAEMLKLHDPVIRNDLLMLLGSQQEDTISTREAKEALRGQALEAVRKVIASEGGEGGKVENVYFTSFVMQ